MSSAQALLTAYTLRRFFMPALYVCCFVLIGLLYMVASIDCIFTTAKALLCEGTTGFCDQGDINAVACRTLNNGKGKVSRDACRHCRPSASMMLLSSKHCLLRMTSSGSVSDCDKEVILLRQSQNLHTNTLAA